MREAIGRRILAALERHTPGWVKSFQIQILLHATAEAFGCPGRRVWHLPAEKALAAYAAFTTDCLARGTADPERLFRCAAAWDAASGDCPASPEEKTGRDWSFISIEISASR